MTARQIEEVFYQKGIPIGGAGKEKLAKILGISASFIPDELEHYNRGIRRMYCPRAVAEWYVNEYRVPGFQARLIGRG